MSSWNRKILLFLTLIAHPHQQMVWLYQLQDRDSTPNVHYQPSYNISHTMKSSDPLLLANGTLPNCIWPLPLALFVTSSDLSNLTRHDLYFLRWAFQSMNLKAACKYASNQITSQIEIYQQINQIINISKCMCTAKWKVKLLLLIRCCR